MKTDDKGINKKLLKMAFNSGYNLCKQRENERLDEIRDKLLEKIRKIVYYNEDNTYRFNDKDFQDLFLHIEKIKVVII